jgi:hypothetical protein
MVDKLEVNQIYEYRRTPKEDDESGLFYYTLFKVNCIHSFDGNKYYINYTDLKTKESGNWSLSKDYLRKYFRWIKNKEQLLAILL